MNSKIGLKRGAVKLSSYSNTWKKIYKKEEKILKSALKNYVELIDIQHVGSTSIPKLKAKPIIDIGIGLKSLKDSKKCIEPLNKLDYEYRHDAGVKDRHFFAKGPETNRTHYLHLVKYGDKQWENLVLFRDYLKKFPKIRQEYQKLKETSAKKYKNDRKAYTHEKDKFIVNIIKQAKKLMKI